MTDRGRPPLRLAALDIGSLTVRLAVAEITVPPAGWKIIHRRRFITHLGADLERTGRLSAAALNRTLDAVAADAAACAAYQVAHVRAVATQAVRRADNRALLLAQIKDRTGMDVQIISPTEEAALTLQGVLSVLDPAVAALRPLVVFDLGGGSTEFAVFTGAPEPALASLPLGALSLTQVWLPDDPPPAAALAALRTAVTRELEGLPSRWGLASDKIIPAALVGTAGTVTTLAAISLAMADYNPGRVNNLVLDRRTIDRLTATLASQTAARRARVTGLEPGKAGVIVAGAVLVQAILAYFRQDRLVVSDAGLLEGVLERLVADSALC